MKFITTWIFCAIRLTRREEARGRQRERKRRRFWPPDASHWTSTTWTRTSWGVDLLLTCGPASSLGVTCWATWWLFKQWCLNFPAGIRSMSCMTGCASWSLRSLTTRRSWNCRSTRWELDSRPTSHVVDQDMNHHKLFFPWTLTSFYNLPS